MTRLMSPSIGRAGRLVLLGSVFFLAAMSCAVRAETTGAVTPAAAPAETTVAAEPAKAEPAQDDCQPIGLTASGEIVYPFHCKAFVEQHKAAEAKPTVDGGEACCRPSDACGRARQAGGRKGGGKAAGQGSTEDGRG